MKMNIKARECNGCGEEIDPRRVKAMPQTNICVGCQEENENAGKFALHKMSISGVTRCDELDEVKVVIHRGVL